MTQNDIKALMKGVAPVLNDQIAKGLEPFARLLVELKTENERQAARIAALEQQQGYEHTGTKDGKPRVRLIAGRAA